MILFACTVVALVCAWRLPVQRAMKGMVIVAGVSVGLASEGLYQSEAAWVYLGLAGCLAAIVLIGLLRLRNLRR